MRNRTPDSNKTPSKKTPLLKRPDEKIKFLDRPPSKNSSNQSRARSRRSKSDPTDSDGGFDRGGGDERTEDLDEIETL